MNGRDRTDEFRGEHQGHNLARQTNSRLNHHVSPRLQSAPEGPRCSAEVRRGNRALGGIRTHSLSFTRRAHQPLMLPGLGGNTPIRTEDTGVRTRHVSNYAIFPRTLWKEHMLGGESGGRTHKACARRGSNPVPSPSFGLSLQASGSAAAWSPEGDSTPRRPAKGGK